MEYMPRREAHNHIYRFHHGHGEKTVQKHILKNFQKYTIELLCSLGKFFVVAHPGVFPRLFDSIICSLDLCADSFL